MQCKINSLLTLFLYGIIYFMFFVFLYLRFQGQGSSQSVAHNFFKEVILLPDHKATHVPRRASKAWLFENGHIKSALEFGCDWDSDTVMEAIKTAFQPAVEGCR